MARDFNQCTFTGRLGADPETRYMPSGEGVTNFRIAVGEKWKDKNSGDQQERTEWVPIVAFGKLSEICAQYLKKGSQVLVQGKFRTRKWQKDGVDRYTTEIVIDHMQMFGGKDASRDGQNAAAPAARQPAAQQPQNSGDIDDDIPF